MLICIRMNLVLGNLQWLMSHKTQPNLWSLVISFFFPGLWETDPRTPVTIGITVFFVFQNSQPRSMYSSNFLPSFTTIDSALFLVGDLSRGWPEGSPFNSFYTEVLERALLYSLDCSNLPLICTLFCWVLSKEVSSTIFKVFWHNATLDWTQVSRAIGENKSCRP